MTNEVIAQEEKRSLPRLLWGILVHPTTTLTYLKDNHKKIWWVPALLILALTLAPLVADYSASRRTSGLMMEEFGIMEPEMNGAQSGNSGIIIEGDPGMMGPPPGIMGVFGLVKIVGAIPGTIIAWLIWGAALYLVSVFLGRSSNFGQMFRLTVWTRMPYAVRGLVQAIYIFATGNRIVNAGLSGLVLDKNTIQLFPPETGQVILAGILERVDVYLIWNLALLTLGLMAFTNLPRKKALTATLVIWAILTLLGVTPAILGGMFG